VRANQCAPSIYLRLLVLRTCRRLVLQTRSLSGTFCFTRFAISAQHIRIRS
jgi:hypothetical protein